MSTVGWRRRQDPVATVAHMAILCVRTIDSLFRRQEGVSFRQNRDPMENQELRRLPRYPKLFLIVAHEEDASRPHPGLIVDINGAGARLLAQREFPVERRILLTIQLQEDLPLRVGGKVVWRRQMLKMEPLRQGFAGLYGDSAVQFAPGLDYLHFLHGLEFEQYCGEVEEFVLQSSEYPLLEGREDRLEKLLLLGSGEVDK
ncbi:MAG: PilZ domain-containing protein [Armatimonadetes bacterium]|nr:PilZ domain-containing protein [Armatimonadota bacterium]